MTFHKSKFSVKQVSSVCGGALEWLGLLPTREKPVFDQVNGLVCFQKSRNPDRDQVEFSGHHHCKQARVGTMPVACILLPKTECAGDQALDEFCFWA